MAKPSRLRRILGVLGAILLVVLIVWAVTSLDSPIETPSAASTNPATSSPTNTDAELARLFEEQASDVQIQGEGTVQRLLDDDNEGSRHQRFILRLDSGQTLLVAHNIDIAPYLTGLTVGDRVGFFGEYVYSDQGGTIHWTHHDPRARHVAGWLEWNGKKYS